VLLALKTTINPFTPIDLYGMFQIKTGTIPFGILRVERVNISYRNIIRSVASIIYVSCEKE